MDGSASARLVARPVPETAHGLPGQRFRPTRRRLAAADPAEFPPNPRPRAARAAATPSVVDTPTPACQIPPASRPKDAPGEVTEWSKVLDWKSSVRATVPRVR